MVDLSAFKDGIVIPISADTKGLKTGLSEADAALDKTQSKFSKTTSFIQNNSKAIGAAATVAGAAVVGGFAVATSAAVDFEKSMAEVFTLLPNLSAESMQEMEEDVRDLSVELGVTTDELIPALYQAISAGVPTDNVFEFLRTSNAAAVGGVTDLTTSVDGISSVINAYGTDVIDATKASDLMFTAVKLGKTNFEELSGSLYNVTPLAAALGLEFGNLTSAMATMTSQGVPTAQSTTQLRQLLVELSDAESDVGEAFEQVSGVSFKEYIAQGKSLYDALNLLESNMGKVSAASIDNSQKINKTKDDIAKYKDQLELARIKQSEFTATTKESSIVATQQKIDELTKKISGLESELVGLSTVGESANIELSDLFSSVEAKGAVFALTGDNAKKAADNYNAMSSAAGATETASETMGETTEIALNKAIAAFEDIKLELGNEFIPILKDDLLPILKMGLDLFKSIPDGLKPGIVIIGALGAALVVLGPLLIALPGLIAWINAAMLLMAANPIVLTIAAIALGITGLILLLKYLNDKFDIVTKATDALDTGIKWLTDGISTLINWISSAVDWSGVLGTAFKILLGPIGWVMIAMDLLGVSWDDVWEGMISITRAGLRIILGVVDTIVGTVKGAVNWIISGINTMISGLNRIKFDVPDWVPLIGGNSIGFNLPKIPMLAEGGIVTRPTIAMIGEAGPEAVVPLSQLSVTNNDARDYTNNYSEGGNVNINVDQMIVRNDQDIKALAKELYNLIDTKNRARGVY